MGPPSTTTMTPAEAEHKMLEQFADNGWFLQNHWPENRERVWRIMDVLLQRFPTRNANVLDVGCFNGYMSLLAHLLGFAVIGSDAVGIVDRQMIFREFGIRFVEANLNDPRPFAVVEDATYDAVIFGEILEHILNHPLGVLKELARVLKPGGLLIVTTPNPSTMTNAMRVLLDRYTLWGTESFGEVGKFSEGGAICQADIHYREYRTSEVTALLKKAGFSVGEVSYMAMGSPVNESTPKRLVKRWCAPLFRQRLFANTQFLVATR